jgi:hypothetical protein
MRPRERRSFAYKGAPYDSEPRSVLTATERDCRLYALVLGICSTKATILLGACNSACERGRTFRDRSHS